MKRLPAKWCHNVERHDGRAPDKLRHRSRVRAPRPNQIVEERLRFITRLLA